MSFGGTLFHLPQIQFSSSQCIRPLHGISRVSILAEAREWMHENDPLKLSKASSEKYLTQKECPMGEIGQSLKPHVLCSLTPALSCKPTSALQGLTFLTSNFL